MHTIIFLLGLVIGSFLNVLIDRLPHGEDVLWTRSRCDHCKKTLRWFELIPLLSWIIQRGRCRHCHTKLPIQYPIVELMTALIFTYLPWQSWIIFSSLLVIFVADLKYMIIPDMMVVVGIIGVLLQGDPMWVAAVGASFFFVLLFLVTRGRGMGLGDVKLAFLLGLLLGYPKIIFALYAAFLTGAVVGVILMVGGKKSLKSRIAFGPFLIVGTLVTLLFDKQLLALWNSLF